MIPLLKKVFSQIKGFLTTLEETKLQMGTLTGKHKQYCNICKKIKKQIITINYSNDNKSKKIKCTHCGYITYK